MYKTKALLKKNSRFFAQKEKKPAQNLKFGMKN